MRRRFQSTTGKAAPGGPGGQAARETGTQKGMPEGTPGKTATGRGMPGEPNRRAARRSGTPKKIPEGTPGKTRAGVAGGLWACSAISCILIAWQLVCSLGLVESFMLPSPVQVAEAFISEFPTLMGHLRISLAEAFVGLFCGILLGFSMAVLMDRFEGLYKAFYPLIVLTQSIPAVAIAPLLVLWFGYEMTPKVILIVITTFFPVAVGLLNGFRAADRDSINLLKAMGAGRGQIFWYIKFPGALSQFFAGLRISASYAVVGAVISEWLGGFGGLGVYMTRVRKAYAFDKMFAVIFLISIISLVLMKGVGVLQRRCMPWERHAGK